MGLFKTYQAGLPAYMQQTTPYDYRPDAPDNWARAKERQRIMAQGGMQYLKNGQEISRDQAYNEEVAAIKETMDLNRASRLRPDLAKASKNPALSAITDNLTASLAGLVKGQDVDADKADAKTDADIAKTMAEQAGLLNQQRGYADEDIAAIGNLTKDYADKSESLRANEEALAGRARDISYGKANSFMERYGAKSPGMGVGTELYNAAGAAFAPVELDYLKSVGATNRDALDKLTGLRQSTLGKRGALISGIADRVRDLSYEPGKLASQPNRASRNQDRQYAALANLTNLYNAQNFLSVGRETGLRSKGQLFKDSDVDATKDFLRSTINRA